MQDKRIYGVWFQQSVGYASTKLKEVLDFYIDIEKFYKDDKINWRLCGCFSPKDIDNLSDIKNFEKAKKIVKRCDELGYRIISIDDDEYPELLKSIIDPPAVLYVYGELMCLKDKLVITIIGTRDASNYGKDTAFKLSYELAKRGCVVVSGGAIGIDSCAHRAALQVGGKTILVLGCGINSNYLKENLQLRNQVAMNGAVISEYPPDDPVAIWKFPQRNRILSGLSNGVVVVEAGKKSGTMITVKHALEQNRDIFAVPGNIESSRSYGTNHLIKEGAKIVTCVDDILEEYIFKTVQKDENADEAKKENGIDKSDKNRLNTNIDEQILKIKNNISENSLKVYNALSYEPKHIDYLAYDTNLDVSLILQSITELELNGIIESLSGKRYIKKRSN